MSDNIITAQPVVNGIPMTEVDHKVRRFGTLRGVYVPCERNERIQKELNTLMRRDNAATEGAIIMLRGDSGSGKTVLLKDFIQNFPPQPRAIVDQDGNVSDRLPVVMTTVPETGLKELVVRLFWEFTGIAHSLARRDVQRDILDYATRCETALIVFDEVHQALAGNGKAAAQVANLFRELLNQAQFSLLIVGTDEARAVMRCSPELERRMHADIKLKPHDWDCDRDRQEFRSILNEMDEQAKTVLGEKSDLAGVRTAGWIHSRTGGNLGKFGRLFERGGIMAARAGARRIEREHFVQALELLNLDEPEPVAPPLPTALDPGRRQIKRRARRAAPDRELRL